jgi:hypothetical protein
LPAADLFAISVGADTRMDVRQIRGSTERAAKLRARASLHLRK